MAKKRKEPEKSAIDLLVEEAVVRRKGGETLDAILRTLRETHPDISQRVLRRNIIAASK